MAAHVKRLVFIGSDNVYKPAVLSSFGNYPSCQDYLADFTSSFSQLETLELTGLQPPEFECIPCFPSIKHLLFKRTSPKASQLLNLILAAISLESVAQRRSGVLREEDVDILLDQADDNEENDLVHSPPSWANLRSYSTEYDHHMAKSPFEVILFPSTIPLSLPSVQYLTLRAIGPKDVQTVSRLLKATSKTLRYLRLRVGTPGAMPSCGNVKFIS